MSRYRPIDPTQANQVQDILVEECGYRPSIYDDLVRTIRTDALPRGYVCHEYRFQGALGFGGKFRNKGNRDNTPYVDCYPEHLTPARQAMIDRANDRLREIFK